MHMRWLVGVTAVAGVSSTGCVDQGLTTVEGTVRLTRAGQPLTCSNATLFGIGEISAEIWATDRRDREWDYQVFACADGHFSFELEPGEYAMYMNAYQRAPALDYQGGTQVTFVVDSDSTHLGHVTIDLK